MTAPPYRSHPPASHSSRRSYVLVGLAVFGLVVAFLHAEYYTVYGPFLKLRDWGSPPAWAQFVRQARWPVRALAALCLAALFVLELKGRLVSRALAMTLRDRVSSVALLALLGGLSGYYLLLPGYLQAASGHGDGYTQLAWMIRDALDHRRFPIWSNWGDMGFPLMQFYSPLYFAAVALASYVIPNIWIAVKVVLYGLHILSVLALFLLTTNLTKSRLAGLAAAFAVGFAYYRYHTIVYFNSFVRAPAFVLWPLQLYFVEKLLVASDGRRAGVGLALTSALGLLAHFYFGAAAGFLAAVYAFVRVFTLGDGLRRSRARALVILSVWFALGVLASLFFTLPAVLESRLTVIPERYAGSFLYSLSEGFRPDVLRAVLTFEGGQGTLWLYGYAGDSILLLALVGCLSALVRKKWYALAPLFLLVFGLFLTLGPVRFLVLGQDQYLPFVVCMGALGVGICMAELQDGLPGDLLARGLRKIARRHGRARNSAWLLALVCLPVAVDMWRYTLSRNYLIPPTINGSRPERVAAHNWLAVHADESDGRVLEAHSPENVWQVPMVAGLPTFQNNGDSSVFSAPLTRSLRHATPNPWGIAPYAAEELFEGAFSLLLIANVDWVIVDSPSPLENHGGAIRTEDGAVLVPTGGGLPAIASAASKAVTPVLQLAGLANQLQIDRSKATAAFIPVQAPVPPLAGASAGDAPLELTVRQHVMEGQYVRLEYSLSAPAYLQLSYGYYPYLRVLIDGQAIDKFPTAFGLIGVRSPPGAHTLEIVPYLSLLRVVVGVVNLVALSVLAALWVGSFRRRRHGDPL